MKVGVDTGGTFTDVVFVEDGKLKSRKVFSTPGDPSRAVLNGIEGLHVSTLIHGTTVGTNAFLERKGANIAFITTRGFKDILFIGRQNRASLYDLFVEKPKPILSPDNCLEVLERVSARGEVLIPLNADEALKCIKIVERLKVESVAICLLNSYIFFNHELALKEMIQNALNLEVSVSCEILPEFREFERASTTAVNAYLVPVMKSYISRLENELPCTNLYIQQSNGGWLTAKEAERLAVHTILSGPAAGVSGALQWSSRLGYKRIITFDMGGTSTDVCLINEALPFTKEYNLDGYPISIPVIDIHTVGAGGGSIAYVDAGGALKVGPESAGADPGPACYGKSNLPTVTDANLVTGRILSNYFLGGSYSLDVEAAKRAIFDKVAKPLGLNLEEAALGIIKVANVNMSRALRRVSLERGFDPEVFALFCFGGAGGLHACSLARALGIRKILIPKIAGGFSALGLIMSPPIKDFSQTVWLSAENKNKVKKVLNLLKHRAQEYIKRFRYGGFDFKFYLDMRYKGQGFEISVPFEENYIDKFQELHYQQFGYTLKESEIEVVTVRLRATGKTSMEDFKVEVVPKKSPQFDTKVFTEKGWIKVPVVFWNNLKVGEKLNGPILILEDHTTVWIEDGFFCEVKEDYTLEINREGY